MYKGVIIMVLDSNHLQKDPIENIILRDWFTFTSKSHDPFEIVEALGLSSCSWTEVKGWYGYRSRLFFGNISIHYDGAEDMGVCCEMSGQGCRNFETYTTLPGKWADLLRFVSENNLHVTRLDIAYDDHCGVVDIQRVKEDTEKRYFVSRFRNFRIEHSFSGEGEPEGLSLYYGSQKSDAMVRIYDKAAERGYTDGRHWVRIEMQLRGDRAAAFLDLDLPIGKAFAGALLNYLRFVQPVDSDSNKRRWEMTDYWFVVLGDVERISLYSAPGAEYNVEKCKHFVVDIAGNAIAAMMEVCGSIEEFEAMIDNRTCAPNPKYEIMLREHHAHMEQLRREMARRLHDDEIYYDENRYIVDELEGKQLSDAL